MHNLLEKINFVGVDDWYALSDDDDTTSSMHSGKYSALHYASGGHEEEEEDEAERAGPSCSSPKARNNITKFGPGESPRGGAGRTAQEHAGRARRREDERHAKRLTRNRSMVDMRSQLLHRTLVEELNRRLFFNTVGAVESVGFRAPSPSPSTSPAAAARGRRTRDGGGGGQQRYYML